MELLSLKNSALQFAHACQPAIAVGNLSLFVRVHFCVRHHKELFGHDGVVHNVGNFMWFKNCT
jgi:hypothetical protein